MTLWSTVLQKHCDGSTFDVHSTKRISLQKRFPDFPLILLPDMLPMKPHYTPTHPPTQSFCFRHTLLSQLMTDRAHEKWGFERFKKETHTHTHQSSLHPSDRLVPQSYMFSVVLLIVCVWCRLSSSRSSLLCPCFALADRGHSNGKKKKQQPCSNFHFHLNSH